MKKLIAVAMLAVAVPVLAANTHADAKAAQAITNNADARALAVQAARQTTVLLKNDGALPLHEVKTLAVIGPNAARVDLGGYSNVPNHTVSLLDGIKAKVGSRIKVLSAEGVRITDKGGTRLLVNDAEPPDIEAKLAELQSPRGWGLFLIKNMVDDMRITSDATHHTVELMLYLEGGDMLERQLKAHVREKLIAACWLAD